MAARPGNNLLPETGRELCRVRGEEGECLGYRQDILTEILSERDKAILLCPRCQGILKEACTSSRGDQLCSCCKRGAEQIHPNVSIRSFILSLKCSCPLSQRDCGWLGTLGDCENHLEVCNYVLEMCSLGCGEVLQRGQIKLHKNDKCVNRKMEVECELGCGMLVYRDNMTQHILLECGEKEIECPFVKYKCEVELIKRRKLDKHLEKKRTEHFELKVNAMEEIIIKLNEKIEVQEQNILGQNKIISELNDKLERYSQEIKLLKNETEKIKKIEKCEINLKKEVIEPNVRSLAETLMNRPNFTKLEWKIKKIEKSLEKPAEKLFQIDVYYFKLVCIWGNRKVLLLKFCPQIGWNYDKLEWPFRAEFIIRSELTTQTYSSSHKNYSSNYFKNVFQTEVIEVGKEQFRSCTEITIAAISEDRFSFDGFDYVEKITFEIYVIL